MLTTTTTVPVDASTAWRAYTDPEHVVHWNFASPEWHCPRAEADLVPGGRYASRMEARDGSMGFDFEGTYDLVDAPFELRSTLGDGRRVFVAFEPEPAGGTQVVVRFDPESQNPEDMQRQGWQAILDNYGRYTATLG